MLSQPQTPLAPTRSPRLAEVPPFGLAPRLDLLDAPFRHGVSITHTGPGDVLLATRLSTWSSASPVLVHWEVATDAHFRRPERYGLLFAEPPKRYAVRVPVCGLEPGRSYWARFWAGGVWSRTVRLRTGTRPRALSRA